MKKISRIIILCISIMLIVIGCSKKDPADNANSDITPTPSVTDEEGGNTNTLPLENPIIKEDYDFNDYIKLGQYKGIEVKAEKLEVTDEDVDIAIQEELYDYGATPVEVTDRPVRLGDTVNIDFVGYHNGEAFDGGSANGYDLTIGSGAFIKGFEEQLIGAELSKEIEVNVVFPENYSYTKLAGEPAVFKVTINKIQYFELTEDIIKDLGFESEEAYRNQLLQELTERKAESIQQQKENYIYDTVIKNSEITLPENLVEYYANDFKTIYNNIAASYGYDLESFISLSGYSMEEFEKDVQYYSTTMATRELVIKAISSLEGIEVTDEEFQAKVTEYAENYGYESAEEFLAEADVEALKDDMLFEKVIDFLVAESVEI
ncbi:trigger factor [Herbinix hemicellulosilytica]|uniref:peptidylprolyl isomerase n=1 Tax=Herbinix hemicellulosilytica TaxID=1564487 RepID=A0A0H5SJD1_HERHM|nr:trigger factor [Herbinix hemicellulosilytica]RBP58675.1 trigger factor [Herbinix hemicellulosilytica]CRZ35599.1 putative secreted protein [Herbinix hemicellulosilytica]